MRAIIFALLMFAFATVQANTYYFSNSSGNDSRSAAEAQNPSTPWRTISKLNSIFSSLKPGDAALFQRGETFYGSIDISKSREKYGFDSGNDNTPIIIGAYGDGAKPVITGLQTVTNWAPLGNGIYETTLGLDNLNLVTFQGNIQPIGRWPKLSAPGNGYLAYQSHVGTSSISSNATASAPNFTGGEVVIRKTGWMLDRGRVTSQNSSTVYYAPLPSPGHPTLTYEPHNNFGFFFQNHINALTELGDWMYDPSNRKLRMYFGGNSPYSFNVQVPTVEKLVTIHGSSFITIDNLALVGSNTNAISMDYAYNIQITNTDINLSGIDAITTGHFTVSSDITVRSCNITNTINNCITAKGTANWTIQNNVIKNTGLIRGMGQSGDGQYNAVSVPGSNSLIEYNEIINTGYIPIDFRGEATIVKNNFIDNFCLVKSDGGGVYTFAENGKKGRKVIGNIILNGIGDRTGRPSSEMEDFRSGNVHGVYMDGGATDVEVLDNTVAHCSSSGLELSSPVNMNVINNTFFDNTYRQIYYWESFGPISNLKLKNNILFALKRNQLVASIDGSGFNTPNWGVLADNYYCRPLSEPDGIDVVGYSQFGTLEDYTDGGIIQAQNRRFYSLDKWKELSRQDWSTKKTPIIVTDPNNIRFEYNATRTPKTIVLNSTYLDVRGIIYSNSVTLAPYTSVILLKDATSGPSVSNQNINFAGLNNKTYGDAAFSVSATATSGLPVSFRIVSGPATINNGTITLTGTGTVVVEASQEGNASFSAASPVTQSFVVSQASKQNQVISFVPLPSKNLGDEPFSLSPTSSSGLPVSLRIFSGPATLSNNVVTLTGVGSVVIEAFQVGDASYNPATPVTRSFNVSQVSRQNQVINFASLPSKNVDDAPFSLSATSSSGLPVSLRIFSGPATLSNNVVTLTGVGSVVVEAFQVGDANYNPATPVVQSFSVIADQKCKISFKNNGEIVADASCGLNNGALYIVPTSGSAPYKYSKNGGATYVSGPNDLFGFINLAAGTYRLRLKDANGCESDIVEKTVKSVDCPTSTTCTPPRFKNNGEIVAHATCSNNDGSLYIVPTRGTAPFLYSKDGGATYVAGPNDIYSFNNLSAGTYKLRIKDANGCESEVVEKKVNVLYGLPCYGMSANAAIAPPARVISETLLSKEESIKIFPNPSQGQFKVQLVNFAVGAAEVNIVDGKGSILKKSQINVTTNNNTLSFDLSGYAEGLYYIKIINKTGAKTSKVIIQK